MRPGASSSRDGEAPPTVWFYPFQNSSPQVVQTLSPVYIPLSLSITLLGWPHGGEPLASRAFCKRVVSLGSMAALYGS